MKIRDNILFILSCCLGLPSCSGLQSADNPPIVTAESPNIQMENLTTKIEALTTRVMEDEHIPGAAIVIVKDGETVFKRGYGFANLDDNIKVSPDITLFRIGSVSKALTLQALVRLSDKGRIDLDDEVSKYIPALSDIPNVNGSEATVRLRHLVTHTSGLDQIGLNRHIWELEKTLDERKALRPDLETFLFNGNLRRTSPPGLHYRYDTYGTTLAGLVLEKVTGKPYAEAMDEILFKPLGMSRSYVEAPVEFFDDLAIGYGYVDEGYGIAPYEVYVTTPASSIDATPADMGRLLEVLTKDITLAVPQFRPHPDFPGVTKGFMEHLTADDQGRHPIRSIGHGGSMLGYRTSFTVIPELKLGYFIITNRNAEAGGGRVSLHNKINDLILDAFHTAGTPKFENVPEINPDIDLSTYEGNYYYGVFCQTCTQKEFDRGAWKKGRPVSVREVGGVLLLNEDAYHMSTSDAGVFIRKDGKRKVFFGKSNDGKISFFSYGSSPDTFERRD